QCPCSFSCTQKRVCEASHLLQQHRFVSFPSTHNGRFQEHEFEYLSCTRRLPCQLIQHRRQNIQAHRPCKCENQSQLLFDREARDPQRLRCDKWLQTRLQDSLHRVLSSEKP